MEENQKTTEYTEYNATLETDATPAEELNADAVQESILEDSDMNSFQKAIARMSEKTWTLLQRVVGALLGIATGVALFWNGMQGESESSGFSYSLIIAVVIAMLIPNIIEKQGARRIPKLRIALVIALAVMIVAYFIYWGSIKGFNLTA